MTDKTYVFNGTEYKMTGRSARKEGVDSSDRRSRRGMGTYRISLLYEIKPVDPDSIEQPQWVRMDDLYEVV